MLFLNESPNAPLKIIDFGTACNCEEKDVLTELAGTPIYQSPEMLEGSYG